MYPASIVPGCHRHRHVLTFSWLVVILQVLLFFILVIGCYTVIVQHRLYIPVRDAWRLHCLLERPQQ